MSSPLSLPPSPPHKRHKPELVSVPPHKPEDVPSGKLFVAPKTHAADSGPKTTRPQKKPKRYLPDPYSSADVLFRDVTDLLGKDYVAEMINDGGKAWAEPEDLQVWNIKELRVSAFTVSGTLLF